MDGWVRWVGEVGGKVGGEVSGEVGSAACAWLSSYTYMGYNYYGYTYYGLRMAL